MAFCRYCGNRLEDGMKFCPSCGAKAEPAAETAGNAGNSQTAPPPYTVGSGGYDTADIERTKVICAVSYIPMLFFLPLIVYPDSRFGKFHANQSLVLLLAWIAADVAFSIASAVITALPFFPHFIKAITLGAAGVAVWALPLAGMICGIVNAANGRVKELPIIGKLNLINR